MCAFGVLGYLDSTNHQRRHGDGTLHVLFVQSALVLHPGPDAGRVDPLGAEALTVQ
jgi:hypothetical protein